MGRADRARRERPSRRLSFRPRCPKESGASSSTFARRLLRPAARLSQAAGRALVLAGLLLSAATLAGGEAQAQTAPLLSTTMTVGSSGTDRGYDNLNDSFGSLGTVTFTHGTTEHTIRQLLANSNTTQGVEFRLHPGAALDSGLVLEWAGETLPLNDATSNFETGTTRTFYWDQTWLAANASTLASGSYQSTLTSGSEVSVCVRTGTQSCSTTSTDATLSGLALTAGTDTVDLNETFASATEDYTASVGNAVDTITVTPTFTHSGASVTEVTLGGTDIADTDFTDGISVPSLVVGANTIVVTVTAEDGTTTKPYTVVVTRAAAGTCADPDLSGRTEVWTANLGVGADPSIARSWYGYNTGINAAGTLSDDKFQIGTNATEYTVTTLLEFDLTAVDVLRFGVNTDIPQADTDKLRLHLCGDTFDLSTATVLSGRTQYEWNPAVVDWSTATTVKVALSSDADITATGAPGITGTPQVGETLTATKGDIADNTDGLPTTTFPLGYTFQWVLVDGVTETDIASATSQTYVPVASDAGKTLKVNVSFTDGGGASETRPSAATQPVAAAKTTCPTGYVWCTEMESGYSFLASGATTIELGGYVPSSSLGSLGDDDFTHAGTAYTVTEINWSRATTSGVVSNTLALVTGAELPDGTVLTLNGTALTVGADSETTTVGRERWNLGTLGIDLDWVTDTKVTTSLNFPNTPATGAPGFTGTPQVGETLTATLGDMADTDGLPTTTFPDGYTFQWVLVDGVTETDISGATSQTYVPVATDAGKTLKVKVSFTDGGGASETLPSAATQPVAGAKTACPTSYVWCTEMESGHSSLASGATTIELGGYDPSSSLGSLDDDDFTHAGTAYTVTAINWSRATTSGIVSNTLALETGAELPDGMVLTLNGTALTVGTDSETSIVGRESWNLRTLGIDFDWVTDTKVTTSLNFPNTPATGAPGITGTPQVGETLTATIGDIADDDGLPTTTFPLGYTFQWVLVDGVTETDIASATSQTYVPVASDAGKTLKVKVTFTDGGGGGGMSETRPSGATAAVRAAAEGCSARTHANWCTTLTAGEGVISGFTFYGWRAGGGQGALDDVTIDYGGLPGWSLERIDHDETGNSMFVEFVNRHVPRGTVFNLGGSEFVADSQSEGGSSRYFWNAFVQNHNFPAGFVPWIDGQKVTVSANLPPVLVSAAVDGDELVLTYAENLDTGSVPAADAYSVSVDSGTAANPSSVGISGTKVTLTLASAVTSSSQTVTVSYAVPASNPVQDASGLMAAGFDSSDHTVANRTGVSNTPATGAPGITGTPQVGETLTATIGDMADGDGLPTTTFPLGYTFQWVLVDGGTETDITSATSQTYVPVASDAGKTLKVKVSFTDGGGASETLASEATAAVAAAPEGCSARIHANWCTTLTVAENRGGSGTAYGFAHGNYGELVEGTIDHGRTWEVRGVWIWDADVGTDRVIVDFQTGRVPHGTVFDFGGESFTANAASEHSSDKYRWDLPAGLAWFAGQKVTVSANLPPEVTGVTVDGDELVLTYAENLDTGSVPAKGAYLVSVDSGTAANPSSVGISGTKVTLTLASAVTSSSQTVTVSYAVPASNPVQDASGLKAAGFGSSDHTVTNNTGVVDDATLTALTLTAGTDSVDLTPAFTSDTENYTATVANGVSQITVAPTFSDSGASADYLDGDDADIADDDTVATGQQVALKVGENTIQVKVTAEDGTTMKTYTVVVTRSDTTAPAVRSATVDGDRVTITFDEPLAPAPNLANGAFTVKVTPSGGGTEATVTLTGSPSISGAKVTLTLASEVAPGATVTVDYTVPGTDNNNRLEDGSGNEVATFANQLVANDTSERKIRLADVDSDGEGRLEVKYRGEWGTVCDDRFDRDFDDPGTPESTKVPNQAAHLACRWAGYETGEMVSNAGKPVAPQSKPIWLDDVRCVSATDKHWRPAGSPDPTRLHHCYNAGVGLHNCGTKANPDHTEDVWLACTGTLQSATQEEEAAALTAAFEDVPGSHDGATPFTFRIVLSEAIANDADDVRDNVVKVTGGSVQSATAVNNQTDEWQITVDPEGAGDITLTVEAGGTCGDPGVLCTAGGEGLSETVTQTVEGPAGVQPLTAQFENGPGTHDGTGPFNVFLRFSEAPANVKNFNIKGALTISGGKILRVRVVGGAGNDEAHRRVEIEPDGDGDVRLSLFPTTDCAATNALCTADGRKLTSLIGLSIPGPASASPPPPPAAPITATFENVPEEHQGKTRLDLHVRFSEPPTGGRNAVAASLTMTRAAKWGVKPLDDTNKLYRSALRPHDFRPITVTLNPTADCAAAGALCTAAGGKLETGISVTIPGPVAIRVADASVEEAADAVLAFAVTLDRVRHDTVTVDYATVNGTATAGEDYTAASGTLTFAAGETAKTVEVAVLDDAHDEGNETLVLRLSNPSGARIADAEATGTIENTDLMPQAWLARFGRTVAEQVIDAVETRMRAPRSPGAEVSLAGRRIGLGPLFGADAAPEGEAALAARARETEAEAEEGQRRLAAWLRGAAEEEERPGLETQTVTERELLLGSSFSLTAAPGDGGPGAVSLWGRAAVSRFDGVVFRSSGIGARGIFSD